MMYYSETVFELDDCMEYMDTLQETAANGVEMRIDIYEGRDGYRLMKVFRKYSGKWKFQYEEDYRNCDEPEKVMQEYLDYIAEEEGE